MKAITAIEAIRTIAHVLYEVGEDALASRYEDVAEHDADIDYIRSRLHDMESTVDKMYRMGGYNPKLSEADSAMRAYERMAKLATE